MPSGILLINKPRGLSSNTALQRVKRAYRAAKAGHVGSLDPLATGMLPICLDEATKVAGEIVSGRKKYEFTLTLGTRTTTGDVEGQVVETAAVPQLSLTDIASVLLRFHGALQQTPPMFSALKRDGRPLYELARQGIEIERAPRDIVIHALVVHEVRNSNEVDCSVECGKGTYVRTLGEDIARALGTVGHVSRLHRAWVEPFGSVSMHALEDVLAAAHDGAAIPLLPIEAVLPDWPVIQLAAGEVARLRQGQGVVCPADQLLSGRAIALDTSGKLVALGVVDEGKWLRPKRIFNL